MTETVLQECFLSSDDAVSLPTGLHTDRDFTFSERSGCNSGNDVSKLRTSYLYEFWPGGGGDGLRGEDQRGGWRKIAGFISTVALFLKDKLILQHLLIWLQIVKLVKLYFFCVLFCYSIHLSSAHSFLLCLNLSTHAQYSVLSSPFENLLVSALNSSSSQL